LVLTRFEAGQKGRSVTATATAAAATFTTATAASAAATVGATEAAIVAAAAEAAAAFTTTAAEAAAASAGRTGFHGTSFVHDEAATTQRLAIHAFDSSLCFGIAAHFHKAEAFGTASVTLHHDLGAVDSTEVAKSLLQVFVANGVWQIANVQFVAHLGTPQNTQKK
jgi:hypothetical protein